MNRTEVDIWNITIDVDLFEVARREKRRRELRTRRFIFLVLTVAVIVSTAVIFLRGVN